MDAAGAPDVRPGVDALELPDVRDLDAPAPADGRLEDAPPDATVSLDGDVCQPLEYEYICDGHLALGETRVAPARCGMERLDTRACFEDALRRLCPEIEGTALDTATDFAVHEVVILRALRYSFCDSCRPAPPDVLRLQTAGDCGSCVRLDYACERADSCGTCDLSSGILVQLVRIPRASSVCLEELPPICMP